ncbi:MAG: hypothetical protein FD161_4836 [Limisphaerales bacterium]|nr:MAG: hypothetical protein FD161_4836 [Limisphaerales bacterium]KAG0506626.1 MAG: hypothetical protein E1N63_4218 [Limisphaerales bacterium]TXT44294.1 MAG: hypothetical protein FD140_4878 [Limisphaerales bacterium]
MQFPFGEFKSADDFAAWAQVSENAAKLEVFTRRALAGEMGDVTPEMREALEQWLSIQKTKATIRKLREKSTELAALAGGQSTDLSLPERVRRCQRLMEEITDAMLDVPEPDRTALFRDLMPARDLLRSLQADGD